MIEYNADNIDNFPDGFQLFFENQNITYLSSKCYVSENPNEVKNGWADILIFNHKGNVNGYWLAEFSIEEINGKIKEIPNVLTVRIKGLLHWSTDSEDVPDNMDFKYFEARKNKNVIME